MRSVLKDDDRRFIPCTMYPLFKRNSARYAPSWPVIPVIKAVLVMSYYRYIFGFVETITLHVGTIKLTADERGNAPENLRSSVFICGFLLSANTNCNGLVLYIIIILVVLNIIKISIYYVE